MRRLMRTQILFAGLTLVVGCGDDDPTGPSPAEITGSWAYTAPAMTGTVGGEPITCAVEDVIMGLASAGDTFTGTTSFGTLTCTTGGDTNEEPFGSYTITNGTIDGNDVEFDFGANPWHHEGTVSGHTMSGTVTIEIDISTEVVVLTGSWSAQDVT